MAEPHRRVDADVKPERKKSIGLAPWQKVLGIIGVVVLLVVVIGFLSGGHISPIQHGAGLP